MIRVDRLIIREFRGIRELDLDLDGKPLAICGPNGTGKRGIVDALEFVLTGTISRLTGRGRGELSIKDHAPHVDSTNTPEKAIVEVYLSMPSLKLKAPVHVVRSVKAPKTVKCSPDTPDIRKVLAQVALHPEIALSRREIIRYILAEPSKRAEDVQELLRLDTLRTIRNNLQRIANACDKDAVIAKKVTQEAGGDLSRTLNLAVLNAEALLGTVNEHRKTLGLEPFQALSPTISIRDGLVSAGGASPSLIAKNQATEELKLAGEACLALSNAAAISDIARAKHALVALKGDEALLNGVKRTELLTLALELYDQEHCSVCDTEFAPDEFLPLIKQKQEKLQAVALQRKEAELLVTPVIDRLRTAARMASAAAAYGPKLKPSTPVTAIQEWAKELTAHSAQLEQLLPIEKSLELLEALSSAPAPVTTAVQEIAEGIQALPESSTQQVASDALTLGQGKLEAFRKARLAQAAAETKARTARKVFDVFSTSTEKALEGIYKKVEGDFSDFYRILNQDDESTFAAELAPSMGKLGFGVDFYKRGFFPPGAFHSEGHQDSMGLCLYLALMKHLQGANFTFAVLDDVLMSVDANHRRQVCRLLKEKFPTTQFVLTTHDRVWLKHMVTEGLIEPKSTVHFRKWDVDRGPSQWTDGDSWDEIEEHLQKNEVNLASTVLRHSLEHFGAEVCQALRAPVEYRGDGQHNPAELLDPGFGEFRRLLKKAKAAAVSWGNKPNVATIEKLDTDFSSALAATKMDQWQVNASIHFNPWANLERKDFEPIVHAFKDVVEKLSCPTCKDLIAVRPPRGSKRESLHCSCGAYNFTLEPKTAV